MKLLIRKKSRLHRRESLNLKTRVLLPTVKGMSSLNFKRRLMINSKHTYRTIQKSYKASIILDRKSKRQLKLRRNLSY
jgi:hypothetical protein